MCFICIHESEIQGGVILPGVVVCHKLFYVCVLIEVRGGELD